MKRAIFARAGDTFFTRSNTLLGRLIRWGETDPGEKNGTWTNHTGVVIESGWIGEPLDPKVVALIGPAKKAVVIEALWHARRGPLELKEDVEVRLFRPVPEYTETELSAFRAEAERYVGAKYGWWKLLVQLADRSIFRGRKVLTTALYMKERPICSFLAGIVNQQAHSFTRAAERLRYLSSRPPTKAEDSLSAAFAFGMPPQAADPDEMMDFCLANPQWWEEVK